MTMDTTTTLRWLVCLLLVALSGTFCWEAGVAVRPEAKTQPCLLVALIFALWALIIKP